MLYQLKVMLSCMCAPILTLNATCQAATQQTQAMLAFRGVSQVEWYKLFRNMKLLLTKTRPWKRHNCD